MQAKRFLSNIYNSASNSYSSYTVIMGFIFLIETLEEHNIQKKGKE